ncbi:MAG TPA: DUF4349 domain-containing protein [Ohtaekwangia sp.]
MKNLIFILTPIILIVLIACGKKAEVAESTIDSMEASDPAALQLASTPRTDLYSNGKTKIIKTLNYRFEVDNVKKSTEAIEAAVKKYPAYISASNLHLENPILENNITIRVQSEYFQDLLKDIDQQARFVNFRDVKTEDVAKEFVDLESRLKTKREVEERYMEILRKKAGTIEELLNAEQQIGELHEEIEATISRINYLKDQVSYSTLNLEFYQTISQEVAAIDPVSYSSQFLHALKSGWNGVMNLVIGLAYIWPLIFLVMLVYLAYRFLKKKNVSLKV